MTGHRENACDTVFCDNDGEFASYFDTWLTFDAPSNDDDDWVYVETPALVLDSRHTRRE